MTRFLPSLLALPLALIAGGALANPAVAGLPKPDSGLWEMKTMISEMGGMTMNMESCVDGTIEEMMQHPEVDNADCRDMRTDHKGNRITASATCTIEGSTAKMNSVFTGDFKKNYRGEMVTTYSPPLHGMAKTTMTIEGRWIAPKCHPGQKPGDTQMKGTNIPGMGNIDLDGLMKNLPGMNR